MTQTTKFALRNFAGKPVRFFRVERDDLTSQAPTPVKNPTHHIVVIDRSGSMYGEMEDIKTTAEKIFTLEEFNDPTMRVSLVSYSSKGDVTLHFSHVTVGDVMKGGSPHLKSIRAIRATALTCISQGLALAETLVDDKETTCITLHTDGFANDSSPTAEARDIQSVIAKLKTHPAVFVNTVAHRGWCDFGLMSSISNQLSGVCIQATDTRQVYNAFYDGMKLLSGTMTPALEASPGGASYMTFVSKSAKKVLGTGDNIVIRGLAATDDRALFRYYDVTEEEYEKIPGEEVLNSRAVFAYCRTQLAEGRINAAKYALVATRHEELLSVHARALVSSDVAAFARAVEDQLFIPYDSEIDATPLYKTTPSFGLPATGPSVLRVLSVLDKHAKSLAVNLPFLLAGYKRRGVKRVPGARKEDGTIEIPVAESRYRNQDEWVSVNGFEINRNTATINMLVSQPIDLFLIGGTEKIEQVAGVSLDGLRSFNNYTLVGDGSLNVQQLMVRTSDKRCWKELKDLGLVEGEYKPNEPFALGFSNLPLVDYDVTFDAISPDEIKEVARLTVLSKILSGMTKGESASLTGEQISELKKIYLTPALNFSPPTTTEYANLDEAIAQGKIDTRLSYKIDIGYPALTSVSKLKSGNEYLQRRFTVKTLDKEVEKPTLRDAAFPGAKIGLKTLSARTTLDEVDALSMPVYESFFGTSGTEEVTRLLTLAGHDDPADFFKTIRTGEADDVVVAASEALSCIEKTIESFYDRVRPLAFYVGATGLVPDSLNAAAMTADQFLAAHPSAKLAKAEKEEGTFFVLPNGLVVTVYVKGEHFTVTQA